MKIGNIISDLFGVSGQEMLNALLSGKPLEASQDQDPGIPGAGSRGL